MTEAIMTDDDVKKMELEAQQQQQQQQQQPPQEKDTKNMNSIIEATAVQVLDDRPPQREETVIIHQYIVSSPAPSVRNDRAVQCCYPVTMDDPVEIARARDIAITQICVELIATVFCSSEWCITTPFVAVLSASLVACCSKLGVTYMLWSCIGAMLCVVHAVTAAEAIIHEAYNFWWPPIVLFFVQVLLCLVSLAVVYSGWKTAAATRRPVHPVEMPLQMSPSMQMPMHSITETQPQPSSQVSRMLP